MSKKFSSLVLTLALLFTLTSCQDETATTEEVVTEDLGYTDFVAADFIATQNDTSSTVEAMTLVSSDQFTDGDLDWSYDSSEVINVTLNQESITITEEGTYLLSGSIADGQIIVNTDAKVHLILNGVTVNSNSSAALYVISADKVFVTLAEGSENTLSNSGEYVLTDDNNVDGAIYSKDDITFQGTGSLTITATYGHGIVAKDDVKFCGGTYTITAESHGVSANNSIRISDGTFTITSGKDGFQADDEEDVTLGYIYIENGTFTIDAMGDGLQASSTLQIDNGTFVISSGGGYTKVLNGITVGEGSGNSVQATDTLETSMKCLKAKDIILYGGTYELSAYEDAIHGNNTTTIYGGTLTIYTGDDAVHADNNLYIYDGTITIVEGYEGLEGNYVFIHGGDISVTVLDDAINASSGYLQITGGDIFLSCSGDGIDSNGDFYLEGGTIITDVNSIYSGGDSEVDVSGTVTHTGGTITDVSGNEIDPSSSMSSGMMGGQSQMGGQSSMQSGQMQSGQMQSGQMQSGQMSGQSQMGGQSGGMGR